MANRTSTCRYRLIYGEPPSMLEIRMRVVALLNVPGVLAPRKRWRAAAWPARDGPLQLAVIGKGAGDRCIAPREIRSHRREKRGRAMNNKVARFKLLRSFMLCLVAEFLAVARADLARFGGQNHR